MTDGCDKQMVLLVVSLITEIHSAMKSELCLVIATQSGDKFIQRAIDFDIEKCVGICEEKGLNVNGGPCLEIGSDSILMCRLLGCMVRG